jgi:hypothetical protein
MIIFLTLSIYSTRYLLSFDSNNFFLKFFHCFVYCHPLPHLPVDTTNKHVGMSLHEHLLKFHSFSFPSSVHFSDVLEAKVCRVDKQLGLCARIVQQSDDTSDAVPVIAFCHLSQIANDKIDIDKKVSRFHDLCFTKLFQKKSQFLCFVKFIIIIIIIRVSFSHMFIFVLLSLCWDC